MSERIDQIIQEIHLKFQIAKEEIALLKNEKNDLLNKMEILKNDNEVLSNALSSKDEFMKSLHSEIEDLKINLNQPNQQSTNHDQLIEEIVKEIDDCISLLKR
jgi:chromosome segregation ATPase